jgi:hypothetical protein
MKKVNTYLCVINNFDMNTVDLKNILIHRISQINDLSFLEALKTILDSKSETKTIQLSDKQFQEIIDSKKEIEEGLYIDNDELNNEVSEWLKEE